MKVILQRRHVVRPADYEAIELMARVELDSENEEDKSEYFDNNSLKQIGSMLEEDIDALLDSQVDRTLRLDGDHIQDTHLWVFYDRDN